MSSASGDGSGKRRRGAFVVPFFTTYLVPAAELRRGGDALSFPVGNTSPGHVEQDGKLVPRPLKDGRLVVAIGDLRNVGRLQQVRVDPNGYIVLVDEKPLDQWPTLALWLVVFGVVGWNLASLALLWRRRQA